ncbi:aryl-alcohol dehydrogenase-like protein [Byssothecium circinans]|uniref:Aryl-alcohol dehydrogenase-like protein n=1 Tax=Byssothecium circinans TaxID=147558 RepID=A0A6A5T8H1_9PLEO|nr:aryl-alcohol dehydrogenase-like protein [Byssothecium circinans]KAF1950838.1 aryl-alcohol dehydrogenase-like protein [Byssothecium circinans]
MSLFGTPPKAASLLDFHSILAPTAGVRVSPLCLGAMNFGDAWEEWMGKCDKKTTFEMLDFFYKQGGNFIDTANNYQNEESETWIGEWLTERGVRDEIVLATKFTTCYPNPNASPRQRKNFAGNSTKSLHVSLAASLKKLQTDYIDLLYVHWWDFSTGIEELMQSLNHMVQRGKVLYLGVSDTPAWVVSKANQYARDHGLRPFSVYQGRWSAAARDFEREILPMARSEGMALAPWGALGSGNFTVAEKSTSGEKGRNFGSQTEAQRKVSEKLAAIAKQKNTLTTSVALAYVRHKAPYVFPIVGGRKVEHLKGNIEALGLELSDEEIDDIDSAVEFDPGFPMNLILGPDANGAESGVG